MNIAEQVDMLLKLGERLDNWVRPGDVQDFLTPGQPLIPEALKAVQGFFPARVIDVLLCRLARIKDFSTQQPVPFLVNPGQRFFSKNKTNRNVILKSGRTGFTSYISQRGFLRTITRLGYTSVMAAHQDEPARDYFSQVDLTWRLIPNPLGDVLRKGALKPGKNNTRELLFPELNNSRFYVETAGDKMAGIGQSLQFLQCTEFAKWQVSNPKQSLTNLTSQLTGDFTEAHIESRPFGDTGYFHELYEGAKRGENGWTPHFLQWWWNPAMTAPVPEGFKPNDEELGVAARYIKWLKEEAPADSGLRPKLHAGQFAWRRDQKKQLGDLMKQEFAEDDISCFIGSGNCPFSAEGIQIIVNDLTPVIEHQTGAGEPENGLIRWRDPESDKHYVAFGDVAGTLYLSRNVLEIFCIETREQVAEWVGRCSAKDFAAIMLRLGRQYNDATLCPENNLGEVAATVMAELAKFNPNRIFEYKDPGGAARMGWKTDERTRPAMLEMVADAVAYAPQKLHSKRLAGELKTCERVNGRIQAQKGKRDDTVLAVGGALKIIERILDERTIPKPWVDFIVADTFERGDWKPLT